MYNFPEQRWVFNVDSDAYSGSAVILATNDPRRLAAKQGLHVANWNGGFI